MSKIRSDILYQRQIKEVTHADQQMRRLHIATPIADDFNSDEEIQIDEIDEEDLIVSDDDDNHDIGDNSSKEKSQKNPNTEEIENQWNTIISQWIEEANYENQVENSSDELLLNGDFNDFLLGTHNIHPADDPCAKWELSSLFVNSLESPTYTGFFSDKDENNER